MLQIVHKNVWCWGASDPWQSFVMRVAVEQIRIGSPTNAGMLSTNLKYCIAFRLAQVPMGAATLSDSTDVTSQAQSPTGVV